MQVDVPSILQRPAARLLCLIDSAHFMPRRLWHRILIGNIALIVLVLAGLAVWQTYSFQRGFSAYLDAIALEQAAGAASRLEQAYANEQSWAFLRRDDGRFGALVGDRAGLDRPAPSPLPKPPYEPSAGPTPVAPMPDGPGHSPPPRPQGGVEAPISPTPWNRLGLLDANRQRVAGLPPQHEVLQEITLVHQGETIGYLQVPRVRTKSVGPEQAFRNLQRQGLLVAFVVSVLISVGVSVWLARNVTKPLQVLQRAIERFRHGAAPILLPIDRRDELGALSQSFNAMTESLHQLKAERDRWTRDIAHELLTPVAILQAEIQAMVDGIRPATTAQLQQLQSECRRLSRLAEDLSMLDMRQGSGFACQQEDIDLSAVVQASADRFRNRMLAQGLDLTCGPLPSAPVLGDPERLAQVLDNVLENALRYTDAPGEVRIDMSCANGIVVLSIEDSAPAVPESSLPHLFERLYRVESSRDRSLAGSGLGLSIAASIVAAHNGQIQALHSPLGGLHIRIQLPLHRQP